MAAQKIQGLLAAEVQAKVISPALVPELQALVDQGKINHVQRHYQYGDLEGAFLAIAATDDPHVNQAVWAEAQARDCLVNVVDDPEHCSFFLPAVVRRGELNIAISTGGCSPALARWLRERIEMIVGTEYGTLTEIMAELRPELMADFLPGKARHEAALRVINSDIMRVILDQGKDAALAYAREQLDQGSPSSPAGIVYLVGAGPGDPGLLTLRGLECLRMADVVVHDRLANRELLAFAPQARLIDVGKEPDHHPIPQSHINAILVEESRAGHVVVRLKGGDPFVFGRGGEEAQALVEADIPFEVVPGVSSAIAAPAYAGIPVTQRDLASSVAFITGHSARSEPREINWQALAQGVDTLVFLMGIQNLATIVSSLLSAGRLPNTPIALIEQGTLPGQHVLTGTLADIVEQAQDIKPPAIIIVGEVVRLHSTLSWFKPSIKNPEL